MLEDNSHAFRQGVRDGIPIALGYLAVSFALGIACKNTGLSALQATVMSVLNVTSAGEFAALTLMASGAGLLEMALTQFVINLRYMLMSCSLTQKLSPSLSLGKRMLLGYCITDEIFGISCLREGMLNPWYSYGALAIAGPAWAAGTCLGVVMGNVLPLSVVSALSVALYGMFIAIIVPPARKDRVIAGLIVLSMAASFVFSRLPFFSFISSGAKIIVLTVLIAGLAAFFFPREVPAEEAQHDA